jgi:hypothetical protein
VKVPVAFIDVNWGGRKIESIISDDAHEAFGLENKVMDIGNRETLADKVKGF